MKSNELTISNNLDIKTMIYEIRGQKIMLDSDLAKLYGYTVKAFNQQVQRNLERFPSDFMWRLTDEEVLSLRSQIVTANINPMIRYNPYAFTEQGVYALSGILKGPLASAVSINLIRAFKQLKDFYIQNNYLLDRVIDIEAKQISLEEKTNDNFNKVFRYINKNTKVKEKIFYKGQIYDSLSLIIDLIRKATKQIILIDNYIDKDTLDILSNRNENVSINIYTSKRGNRLSKLELNKFNEQYSSLHIYIKDEYHDRFLILDNKYIYLIGSSLKDVGKKTFGIIEIIDNKTKIDIINNL